MAIIKPGLLSWVYPKYWWENATELWDWIINVIHRGLYGYARRDLWSMDSYLIDIIIPMLKQLKKEQHGFPGIDEADTEEKWGKVLDDMIEGFEAGRRIIDGEYYLETGFPDIRFDGDIQEWSKSKEEDLVIFHKGMKLFDKWFFSLWD